MASQGPRLWLSLCQCLCCISVNQGPGEFLNATWCDVLFELVKSFQEDVNQRLLLLLLCWQDAFVLMSVSVCPPSSVSGRGAETCKQCDGKASSESIYFLLPLLLLVEQL